MGGNARTTEFLKECLADALIKLMKEKDVERITVSEIAKMASVGRMTYFRYFKSKNELISLKLIKLWERWADEHDVEVRHDYSPANSRTFFEFNHSIKDLLQLIYRRGMQTAVYDAFYSVLSPSPEAGPAGIYRSKFYSYALFGLLDGWISGGFKETPDEMLLIAEEILGE